MNSLLGHVYLSKFFTFFTLACQGNIQSDVVSGIHWFNLNDGEMFGK